MKIIQFIGPAQPLLRNAEHNHLFYLRCGIDSSVNNCAPEALESVVRKEMPDRVVIRGRWCPVGIVQQVAKRLPNLRFYITNHSSVSQMYYQGEFQYYLDTMEFLAPLPNVMHTSVDAGTWNFLAAVAGKQVQYAPNIYSLPREPLPLPRVPAPYGEIHVGLFCALRYQKNVPTQAAAFTLFQRRLALQGKRLFVHYVVKEDALQQMDEYNAMMRPVLRAGAALVNEGWKVSGAEHLDVCRRMTIHSQVSFAETFNYAAGDAVVAGCPVVGTSAIKWLPEAWKVKNPCDPVEVAEALVSALSWDPREGLEALLRYNRENMVPALLGFDLCSSEEAESWRSKI